jgi:ppGpp synthetase/RelA/SpoT-type nucleotidyltranferase
MYTSAVTDKSTSYEEFYRQSKSRYERMREEVEFIIGKALKTAEIKVHSHGGRVKELDHALEKIQRKGYTDPIAQLEDIVGYRVVCLFISDLEQLTEIIRSNFTVLKEEGRISDVADPATFGYMSDHYICKIGPNHSGARYDDIRDIKVEIQCRTILMDAWANVSHYLAYKGEASIPEHLRKDFYALSGLFYVADKHFELFFDSARSSAEKVLSKAATGSIDDNDVNLETLQALLSQMYSDHKPASPAAVSTLVEEIVPHGYTSIKKLRETLEGADEAVRQYAVEHPPLDGTGRFNQVGMVRRALILVDVQYKEKMEAKWRKRPTSRRKK